MHGYKGAIGGKTGFTSLAHRTYWGAASRGGHTLVVTLFQIHEPTEAAARKLLNWGFANLATVTPVGTLVGPLDSRRRVRRPGDRGRGRRRRHDRAGGTTGDARPGARGLRSRSSCSLVGAVAGFLLRRRAGPPVGRRTPRRSPPRHPTPCRRPRSPRGGSPRRRDNLAVRSCIPPPAAPVAVAAPAARPGRPARDAADRSRLRRAEAAGRPRPSAPAPVPSTRARRPRPLRRPPPRPTGGQRARHPPPGDADPSAPAGQPPSANGRRGLHAAVAVHVEHELRHDEPRRERRERGVGVVEDVVGQVVGDGHVRVVRELDVAGERTPLRTRGLEPLAAGDARRQRHEDHRARPGGTSPCRAAAPRRTRPATRPRRGGARRRRAGRRRPWSAAAG